MQDTRRKYVIMVIDSTYCDTWGGNSERYLQSLRYAPHVTAEIFNEGCGGWDTNVSITILSHPETLKIDVDKELSYLGTGASIFSVYDDLGDVIMTEEGWNWSSPAKVGKDMTPVYKKAYELLEKLWFGVPVSQVVDLVDDITALYNKE